MPKDLTGAASAGEMEIVTPEFATRDTGINEPFIDASPPFVLVFDPNRWTILAGRLVPGLITVPLERGVQNVDKGKDGRWRVSVLRSKIEDQGRILIPYNWGPNGNSYIQAIDTRPRGQRDTVKAHISVWERTVPGSRETYPNDEAYAAWAAGLVEAGKLPGCVPHVAQRMLEKVKKKIRRTAAMVEKGGEAAGIAATRLEALKVEATVLAEVAKHVETGTVVAPDLDFEGGPGSDDE